MYQLYNVSSPNSNKLFNQSNILYCIPSNISLGDIHIQYNVDFAQEMSEIISETRYMEQLNFSLPEIARNVSLQEEKYIRYVNGLKQMLKRYNSIIANLNPAEVI